MKSINNSKTKKNNKNTQIIYSRKQVKPMRSFSRYKSPLFISTRSNPEATVKVITNIDVPKATSIRINRPFYTGNILKTTIGSFAGSGVLIKLSMGILGKIDYVSAFLLTASNLGRQMKITFNYEESIALIAIGENMKKGDKIDDKTIKKCIKNKYLLYDNTYVLSDLKINNILESLCNKRTLKKSGNYFVLLEEIKLVAIR